MVSIEVVSEKENGLLHRKELEVKVTGFTATPKKTQVEDAVAVALKAEKDRVVVGSIKQGFGSTVAFCSIKVYADKAAKDRFEPKKKEKKAKTEEKK